MKQLGFGFEAKGKKNLTISVAAEFQKKLELRMAEMIIAVFKNGGIRKDDKSKPE